MSSSGLDTIAPVGQSLGDDLGRERLVGVHHDIEQRQARR